MSVAVCACACACVCVLTHIPMSLSVHISGDFVRAKLGKHLFAFKSI